MPGFVIDFILATPEQRAATMEAFGNLSPQEQADRMAAVQALPEDVQLRMRALISGQPDPGPGAGGSPAQGSPSDASSGAGAAGGGPPGGGRRGGRGGRGGPEAGPAAAQTKAPDEDEAQWIKYSDDHLEGRGFVAWTTFEHPQLGTVEIGGLAPGIRHEPPESEWLRIADEQSAFVADLVGLFPKFDVGVEHIERVAPGVWRLRVRGANSGELPTRSAIGVKARRIPPIVVALDLDPQAILSGQAVVRWDSIAGHGDYTDAEWLFQAPDGAEVKIEVRSSVFGNRTLTTTLKEAE
ncbi:MAG: hypothetical protein IPJ41_06305 [Phycisphaerales bacterium]|nr:hypothetical protein [Phycisphaerales bacterium]